MSTQIKKFISIKNPARKKKRNASSQPPNLKHKLSLNSPGHFYPTRSAPPKHLLGLIGSPNLIPNRHPIKFSLLLLHAPRAYTQQSSRIRVTNVSGHQGGRSTKFVGGARPAVMAATGYMHPDDPEHARPKPMCRPVEISIYENQQLQEDLLLVGSHLELVYSFFSFSLSLSFIWLAMHFYGTTLKLLRNFLNNYGCFSVQIIVPIKALKFVTVN